LLTEEAADETTLVAETPWVTLGVEIDEVGTTAVVTTLGKVSGLTTTMEAGVESMVTPTGADAEALTEASAWAQPVRAATVAAAMTMTRFMPTHSQGQVTQG
jgi:hypothetical protein